MSRRRAIFGFLLGLLFCSAAIGNARASVRTFYQASWQAVLPEGSKGYQVELAPSTATTVSSGATNGQRRYLVIGVDAYDPPTNNPFNVERNIDGRAQREIALFWNGSEVVRRFCPTELLGATGHSVTAQLQFVVGGALFSIRVGAALVFDSYLLPDISPYDAKFVVPTAGALLSATAFNSWGPVPHWPPPIHVRAVDTQLLDKDHAQSSASVDFPSNPDQIGRVVCTLTLARTPHGFDPWDRIGEVYIVDGNETYELARFMTPYRRGYTWKQDVTDLLPLLSGRKQVRIECTTYGPGWLASVDFTFYPGPASRHPYRVVNLWNQTVVIGQSANPFDKQLRPRTITIDPKASAVFVRLIATGHGEDPNTDNAAEFISLWRRLWVGRASYTNVLWKSDNYLNSCRPQGGTWKYDRAGWGPGTVVDPWIVNVTGDVPSGKDALFRYEIQPYTNKTPNAGDPARYVIGSQVIFYKDRSAGSAH